MTRNAHRIDRRSRRAHGLPRTGAAGALLAVLLLAASRDARAADRAADRTSAAPADVSLLARVPYLAQAENLCGGAALAMVLRYWGAQGVYAEDFTALVDEAKGGIDTASLALAPIVRGYRSVAFSGSIVDLKHHLQRGRPVVVLLRLSQSRYHYVVVVGMLGNRMVFHDPARAPFRRMAVDRFDQAWSAGGRWALLVLPGEQSSPSGIARRVTGKPCRSARPGPALVRAGGSGARV